MIAGYPFHRERAMTTTKDARRTERKMSDTACRGAKPEEAVYYIRDNAPGAVPGLRLCIRPNGAKLWMLRYWLPKLDSEGKPATDADGKPQLRESTAGLGAYPAVSLAEARRKAAEARAAAAEGVHPTTARRVRVAVNVEAGERTFRVVAERWLEQGAKQGFQRATSKGGRPWSAHHIERNTGLINRFLMPDLGDLPIAAITEAMVEKPILKAYEAGKRESARRAAVIARQIMGYAKARRWIASNPLADILANPDLPKPPVRHFAAIKPEQVGAMLRALAGSGTELTTRAALMLMMFTGLRDGALRGATWAEIDLDRGTWTVPAARMKSRREHTVPLPRQGVEILRALGKVTNKGPDAFVFASRGKAGYLAENTLRVRLHGLGFKVTAHGFRSLITDLLNEHGFNQDAIERQLDHVQQDRVRAAYLRSEFMPQRRAMMQWLADWAEAQCNKTEAPTLPENVVPLRRFA
jgi:integrase